jgi:hypothetical protein
LHLALSLHVVVQVAPGAQVRLQVLLPEHWRSQRPPAGQLNWHESLFWHLQLVPHAPDVPASVPAVPESVATPLSLRPPSVAGFVPVPVDVSVGDAVPTSQLYEHATRSATTEALATRRPTTKPSIPAQTGGRSKTILTIIVNKPKAHDGGSLTR